MWDDIRMTFVKKFVLGQFQQYSERPIYTPQYTLRFSIKWLFYPKYQDKTNKRCNFRKYFLPYPMYGMYIFQFALSNTFSFNNSFFVTATNKE